MIKVEKKPGGSMTDTVLIKGLIIDKEVAHSDMPKLVKKAKIGLLDAAMEIEKTEFTSKISIETPDEMQAYLDQEEKMLRDMVAEGEGRRCHRPPLPEGDRRHGAALPRTRGHHGGTPPQEERHGGPR